MNRRSARNSHVHDVRLLYEGKLDSDLLEGEIPRSLLRSGDARGSGKKGVSSNMLIEGDNLAALACLRRLPHVAGQVRLIYIDPPFASGQEFRSGGKRTSTVSASRRDRVAYADTLAGSAFLEFLRRRLILLKTILADDGSIYVHIGDGMGHYVKVLMDEVFGRERFVNDIARIKCNPKNFSRRGFGNIKDMILFYTKSKRFVWNEPRAPMDEDEVRRLFPKVDRRGRRYATTPLHAPGETRDGETGRSWRGMSPPRGRHWRVPPGELERLESRKLIEWSDTGNPRKKIFASDALARGKKVQDIWEFKDPPFPDYPTEKNRELLRQIIRASSNPGDLVLDCFAGSGTTLLEAADLGRRWIGIDSSAAALRTARRRLAGATAFREYRCVPVSSADRRRHAATAR